MRLASFEMIAKAVDTGMRYLVTGDNGTRPRMTDTNGIEIDCGLATWKGSGREQLRGWTALPLEKIVLAVEEMAELADLLIAHPAEADVRQPVEHRTGSKSKRHDGRAVVLAC